MTAFAPALDTCGATLSTVYYDAPYTVGQKTFRNWYAKKGYMGYSTIRDGIVYSMNIVAVRCMMETVTPQLGVEYARNSRKYYYASVTFIDEQVGRIVDELKKKGMYDNALICFVADHGDMLGDHHLWRKTYAYEGSAAIPFIIKLPENMKSSLKPGEKIEAPVELRDLLPTFLALNGCRIPEEIDGLSLLPLLEKGKAPWREYIDIEHSTAYWADNYWCALTDGKIKYIWFFRTGEEQLFDLSKDPYELHDLSKAKASGKTLEKMRKAMAGHLQERGEEWVKDGKLVIRNKNLLYSPNYPTNKK